MPDTYNTYKNSSKVTVIKIVAIIMSISNILFAVLLFNQLKISDNYSKKIEEYTREKDNLIKLQEEEIEKQCIAYYEQQLRKIMNDYELNFLAQKQWNYALSLNGKPVDRSIIYVEEDYVQLILAEIVEEDDILPPEILMKGTISGADPNDMLQDHINIFTTVDYSVKSEEKGYNKRVVYELKNIPKGTVITLKLSFLLSERLMIGNGPDWESRIEIIRK